MQWKSTIISAFIGVRGDSNGDTGANRRGWIAKIT